MNQKNDHPELAWVNRGDVQCPWNYRVPSGTEYCCALKRGHLAPHRDHDGRWGDDMVLDHERDASGHSEPLAGPPKETT